MRNRTRTRPSAATNATTASCGRAVHAPRLVATRGRSSAAARAVSWGRWRRATTPAWSRGTPSRAPPRAVRRPTSPSQTRAPRFSGSSNATASKTARPLRWTSARSAMASTTSPRTSRPRRRKSPSIAPPTKTTSGATRTAVASQSGCGRASPSTTASERTSAGRTSTGTAREATRVTASCASCGGKRADPAAPCRRSNVGTKRGQACDWRILARVLVADGPVRLRFAAAMARSAGHARQADAARKGRLRKREPARPYRHESSVA